MSTFNERFVEAFDAEAKRRLENGDPRLTKTMVWKAAKATSGAFTQWYDGTTGAKLDTCFLIAPLLKVNPHWLFNDSKPKHADLSPSPYIQAASKGAEFNANGSATSQSAQPNIDQTLNVLRDLLGELPEPLKKSALLLVSDYLASPDENTAEALQKAITGLLKGHDS